MYILTTIIKYYFYTSIVRLMSIAQATHVEYERGEREDEWITNLFYDTNMNLLESYPFKRQSVCINTKHNGFAVQEDYDLMIEDKFNECCQ